MRKVYFVLLCVFSASLFAQGLAPLSNKVKGLYPDVYEAVKTRAIDKWDDDHEMIVYEINNQIDCYVFLMRIEDIDDVILTKYLLKWSDEPDAILADLDYFDSYSIDWEMVKYEYNNQVAAKNSY